ncbi:sensor histidine kinase [Clostridioides difficile]
MNTTNRFFRKFLFSSILILLVFIIINIGLGFGVALLASRSPTNIKTSISQIANGISIDKQGVVSVNDTVIKILLEETSWAMILNETGNVVWQNALPDDLPHKYTSSDIASFSRWYLEDYPVLVHSLSSGLLVVGYPPNSIIKINHITTTNLINLAVWGSFIVIIINILLVVILFWRNTHKVEKSVLPILNGIETIAQGKPVNLPDKGELAEINIELNRAGQHILQKDKARAEWINGISHDIRTPLSIILGYAGEIEDNSKLPNIIQRQAGIIRKQSEKLRCLITDLNLTSKLEYSMQPLKVEVIYPVELAREVISEFLNNGLTNKFTIDFETNLDDNMITLKGDYSLLIRMLCNLIQNSISHNPQGCEIVVTVCKSEGCCKFEIRDNGKGVSKNQLEQFNTGTFFTPFYKDDSEIAHGFGLRLVYQIVSAHKGKIHFETNYPTGLIVNICFNILEI